MDPAHLAPVPKGQDGLYRGASPVHPVGDLLLRLEGVVLRIYPAVGGVQFRLLLLELRLPALGLQDLRTVVLDAGTCGGLELVKTPLGILDLEIRVLELLIRDGEGVVGLLGCGLGLGQPSLCRAKFGGACIEIGLHLHETVLELPVLPSDLGYEFRYLMLLGLPLRLGGLGLRQLDRDVIFRLSEVHNLVVVLGYGLLELLPENLLFLLVGFGGLLPVLLGGQVDLRILDLLLELPVLGTDLRCDLLLFGTDLVLLLPEGCLKLRLLGDVRLDPGGEPGYLLGLGFQFGLLHLEPPVGVLRLGDVQCVPGIQVLPGILPLPLQLGDLCRELLGDYGDAVQVRLGLGPLRTCLVDVGIEAGDTGYRIEDAAPLVVTHLDDTGDVTLLDQVVSVGTDPGLRQKAVELGHRGLAVVNEEIGAVVLTVVGHLDVTGEPDGVIIPGHKPVRVVEDQRDLGV